MFIGRRPNGDIYSVWANQQQDGQEELPADHPDVVAFLNRPRAAERRRAALDARINGATTIADLKAVLRDLL